MADTTLQIIIKALDQASGPLRNVSTQAAALESRLKGANSAAADYASANANRFAAMQRSGATLTAVGVGITGGLLAAAKSAAAFGDEVQEMGQRTGMSAETLSALQYAASQTGASMGNVEMGVKTLARAAYDASQGNGKAAETFKTLGISVLDAGGKLKSTDQLFFEVGEALRNMESDTQRAAIASELMGRGGMKLIPMFTDAKKSISDFREEARRLGLTIDDETAGKLGELNDKLDEVKQQAGAAFRQLGIVALPILKETANALSWLITGLQNFSKEHPTLASAGVGIAAAIGAIGLAVGPVLMVLPGLHTALVWLQNLRAKDTLQAAADVAASNARAAGLQREALAANEAATANARNAGARGGGMGIGAAASGVAVGGVAYMGYLGYGAVKDVTRANESKEQWQARMQAQYGQNIPMQERVSFARQVAEGPGWEFLGINPRKIAYQRVLRNNPEAAAIDRQIAAQEAVTINIDARGADPRQTGQAVRRAIRDFAPRRQ